MPDTDLESFLRRALEQRKAVNALRTLSLPGSLIDFCSNDYLGLARSPRLRVMVQERYARRGQDLLGSTGSRLISGNSALCEALEERIADFHSAEAGLVFNSGYDANLGLISSVPQRSDTVLYDELVHASIRDGLRLTFAKSYSFRHNDLDELEHQIGRGRGRVFVVVESIYSMDGDAAPLTQMAELCRKHGARLIVDEAHATGVFGPGGRGRVVELDLAHEVFARIHTFGKALGSHGAIVLGSHTLRAFLVNFARSFIYTTFLPPHSLLTVECAYEALGESMAQMETLHNHIRLFRSRLPARLAEQFIASDSPIQSVLIPGNDRVRQAASYLRSEGFDVRPILSPTVPSGRERLRICLHAFNTQEDVERLTKLLDRCLQDTNREAVAGP